MKTFAEILKERIASDENLNESNLAVAAGLNDSQIRKMLKNNSSPRIDTAQKICAALNTTLPEFLLEDQDPVRSEIVFLLSKLTLAEKMILLNAARGIDAGRQQAD